MARIDALHMRQVANVFPLGNGWIRVKALVIGDRTVISMNLLRGYSSSLDAVDARRIVNSIAQS